MANGSIDRWRQAMSCIRDTLLFAHRENIEKFRKLLKTCLPVDERQMFEQQLEEEERALFQIAQGAAQFDCSNAVKHAGSLAPI